MKSYFLRKNEFGNFFILYIIIALCSIAFVQNTQYKTMILSINSKNNFNSKEKINKILNNFKLEISKKQYSLKKKPN